MPDVDALLGGSNFSQMRRTDEDETRHMTDGQSDEVKKAIRDFVDLKVTAIDAKFAEIIKKIIDDGVAEVRRDKPSKRDKQRATRTKRIVDTKRIIDDAVARARRTKLSMADRALLKSFHIEGW